MEKKSLLQWLQEIMDLEEPIIEANKKLRSTTMLVNGIPLYINEFNTKYDKISYTDQYHGGQQIIDVKTLEVWLPRAGLYPLPTGQLALITKSPKRQWNKSFTPEYYSVDVIGQRNPEKKPFRSQDDAFLAIVKSRQQEIAVDYVGDIYYFDKKIGEVKDSNSIVCLVNSFEQELRDWIKNDNAC